MESPQSNSLRVVPLGRDPFGGFPRKGPLRWIPSGLSTQEESPHVSLRGFPSVASNRGIASRGPPQGVPMRGYPYGGPMKVVPLRSPHKEVLSRGFTQGGAFKGSRSRRSPKGAIQAGPIVRVPSFGSPQAGPRKESP
jgi:hypothetical protein